MTTIDLKKQFRHLLTPSAKQPQIITVPAMNFLMVDGKGNPNSAPEFHQAIEMLYGVAYTMKFTLKKAPDPVDYPVMALESVWWTENPAETGFDLEKWNWTLMVMQPDIITSETVAEICAVVEKKKKVPATEKVRLERFDEGLCAQIMHIGSYSAEQPTVAALHKFIAETGHALNGMHHELYLGDPNRTAPEKLKTIIRQQIKKIG